MFGVSERRVPDHVRSREACPDGDPSSSALHPRRAAGRKTRASGSPRLERVAVRAIAQGIGSPGRGRHAQSLPRVRRLGVARGARSLCGRAGGSHRRRGWSRQRARDADAAAHRSRRSRDHLRADIHGLPVARPRPWRRGGQRPAESGFPARRARHPGCGRRPHQADPDLQSEQPDRQPLAPRPSSGSSPTHRAWSRSTRRTPSSPAQATAT